MDFSKIFELVMQIALIAMVVVVFTGVIWSMIKDSIPDLFGKNSLKSRLESLELAEKLHAAGSLTGEEFNEIKVKIISEIKNNK